MRPPPHFLAIALLAARCGDPMPPAGPDASTADRLQPSTCELRVTPAEPQQRRPSERVTFTARVTPAMRGAEVRFALVGDALDGSLSATRVTLGDDGVAVTELTAPSSAASFRVRATVPCTAEVYVPVSVGDRGFGALDVEAVYRGARTPEGLSVSLYRAADCAGLPSGADLTSAVALPGGVLHFMSLPAGLDYVVRAVAHGRDGLELAAACGGPARVQAGATARVVAVFSDAPLRVGDRYAAALAFDLTGAATASAPRWSAVVEAELTRAGGEAALLGQEVAAAVAMASPAATRDRDRAAFEAAYRDRLGAMVTTQLARREVQVAALFDRLGAAAASVAATTRATATATVTPDDRERFTLDGVRYLLDPETPDVRGDDAEVEVAAPARLRIAAGLRDAYALDLDGLALPWNALARSALGAWLSRQGASSSAEYVSVAVCPVVGPILRGATASCDDACVAAACRRAITGVGSVFDAAVATLEPPRMLVDLRLNAAPTAEPGTLTVQQLAGVATGGFREDPSASITASARFARLPSP